MIYSDDKTLKRIEWLQKRMIEIVKQQGFTSEDSIKISQQIDLLLNQYNRNENDK